MTVASDVLSVDHDTDGSTVDFPIPFYFIANTDIVASLITAGVSSPLTNGTDFTVTGAGGQNGGTLTTANVEAAGSTLHIERLVALTQETQYQQNDAFPAKTTEKALDKLTMMVQQVSAVVGGGLPNLSRALLLGVGDINGSGAYRANGNRIQDLADPVNPQDGATRKFVQTEVGKVLTDGAGQYVLGLLSDPLGAYRIGYRDAVYAHPPTTVADQLLSHDGQLAALTNLLNFSNLPLATSPAADADLLTIQQAGVNKRITVATIRVEFATVATQQAAIATAAAQAAAQARDGALLGAFVFGTTAAGLAATTSGQYFSVVATDSNQYVTLLLNSGGTAVPVKVYPSAAYVDSVAAEVQGARAGSPTLNDRINAIVSSVGGTQVSYNGLQGQLQTFRPTADEGRYDPAGQSDIDPSTPQALTVTLPKMIVSRFDADIVIPPTSVTFDPATSTSVTNEAFTLHYDAQGPYNFPGDRLAYLDVQSLVLKRASDGATLSTPGDYNYKEGSGMVWGTQNIADFACLATYTGRGRRYDRVCVNPNTGEILIVKGTDRIVDAAEYRPAEPDGLRTMYWAYVDYRGVTLLAARNFNGYARGGLASADYTRHLDWCKARLVKTIGKALRGGTIRLIGYGDSITAQGGGNPAPDGSVGNQLIPNLDRDKISGYYTTPDQPEVYGRMPPDTQALYPLYDHGDGLGPVHVHLGWDWYLKAALERLGAIVTYRNWGVGGTTSESTITSGLYNGRQPDRLAAATGDGADVAVIAFGMNELGQPYSFANIVAIVRAFQAQGAECIIVTPPMISSTGLRAPIEQWRDTTHQMIEAARATDSAFINCAMIEDAPGYGVSGIPPRDACWINGFNHPGPMQLGIIGRALAELVGVVLPKGWM